MRTPEETLAALDEIEARGLDVYIDPGASAADVPDLVAVVRQLVVERDELRRCWDKMAEALPPGPHEAWATEDHGDIAASAIRTLVAERDEARAQARRAEASERALRDEIAAVAVTAMDTANWLLGIGDHERPLAQSNEPEDQHVPHPKSEDEP